MKKSVFTLITALFALMLAASAFGQSSVHYAAADNSQALRFENIGSETVTINIYQGGSAATNTVVIGSYTNVIDGSGATDTVAELAAAIVAATNSAGNPVLIADTRCSVSTDSTDGELLDGTYTIAAKEGAKTYWGSLLWDTSDVLFYSVYIPAARQDANGVRPNIVIDSIYGNPIGTGAVTASIYLDGAKVWEKLMPEMYESTNNTTSVDLPTDVGIQAGTKSVLVRVTRATTATTGIVGVIATETKY